MAESKTTFCRICEAGCGLVADVHEGRVEKLHPDPAHVVSLGYACVKGIRYTEVHGSPDRVGQPLKREGERYVPIGWEQALSEIGAKVRALRSEHGDQSIGMYMGNPAAFSMPHPLFAQMFLASLGSRNLFTSGSQDCNNKFAVSDLLYGSALIQPIPDVDETKCFVVIGSNPAVSHMSFLQLPRPLERLKAIEKRGGKVFFVNPRRTETASQLGTQVFIRPDTDVFMLLSFVREIFERGKVHAQARATCDGLSELEALAKPWTMERTQRATGIPEPTLRQMIDTYLNADGAALYCSTGVNQGTHGSLAYHLLNAVNLLSGNVDRRGGLLVPKAQLRAAKLIARMSRGLEVIPSRIGGHAPVLGSYPAAILADEIETRGAGQIRAMFVTAGNPVLSCPNSPRLEKALASLDLLVSIDLFRNETGNLAHYILPVTSFLERDDVPLSVQGFAPVPYLQHSPAVVPPREQARDEWWIFSRLAHASGSRLMNSRLLQWWLAQSSALGRGLLPKWMRFSPRLLFHSVALSNGKMLRTVDRHEHGLRLAQHEPASFLGKAVPTANGRVQLAPSALLSLAERLAISFEQKTREQRGLLLIGQRDKTSHNSWMHNVASFVQGNRSTNYLTMHPDDAKLLRIDPFQIAEVETSVGRVRLPVKISREIMPGVVALPHGWGHERAEGLSVASQTTGANANGLTPDGSAAIEPLSGMAQLTAIPVAVKPWLGRSLSDPPPPTDPSGESERFVDLH